MAAPGSASMLGHAPNAPLEMPEMFPPLGASAALSQGAGKLGGPPLFGKPLFQGLPNLLENPAGDVQGATQGADNPAGIAKGGGLNLLFGALEGTEGESGSLNRA